MKAFFLSCVLLCASSLGTAASPEDAIKKVLDDQVIAWNGGDLKQFVSSYADRCTLVGSTIAENTRAQVLEHYEKKYPTAGSRGKLTFSELAVRPLDQMAAIVTGHFHLDRNKASGGPANGVFSLVLKLNEGKWQIVLDHTS